MLSSLYYGFSKKKYLGFAPFFLAIVILLVSIGPWSVYRLPEARQYDRLVANLERANILKDGAIVPLMNYEDIGSTLSTDVYDGIEYMCDFSECAKIKILFADELNDAEKKGGANKWEIVKTISDAIKVRYSYSAQNTSPYISFHIDYNESRFPIPLGNYAFMTDIKNLRSVQNVQSRVSISVAFDDKTSELVILN